MTIVLFKKYLPEIAGTLIGATGGFLYWKFVGCVSGTCAIKSNWYLMVPWGMILGYLVGSMTGDYFRKKRSGKITKS
ncbi:MAG: hypothetical protein MUC78_04655 [Bacteroidales bacterium]|jgi:hypothetical protein|nr:hypothetical protein [Bacteroidales bacterium]